MVNSDLPSLLKNLFALLEAHRPAFSQQRIFLRALGLFLSEIFTFGRHTVTQGLLALGLTDADWSPWYRLFSLGRFQAEKAAAILLGQTLQHVPDDEPYIIGVDGVGVPRTGRKMPGTAWLPALFTAPFRRGLQRIQRFLGPGLAHSAGRGIQPGHSSPVAPRLHGEGRDG